MVTSITSFGRSGLYDWMMQRVTAVVLLAYTIFMIGYLLMNPELDYNQWKELFSGTVMRIFTLLAVLSMVAHAWIGMWSVSTDLRASCSSPHAACWRLSTSCGAFRFCGVSKTCLNCVRLLSTQSSSVVVVPACALRCSWHSQV